MSEPEWLILRIAPALFLIIASAKLIIEELISLVKLFKKLKATINSEYSLESGKLKVRSRSDIAK
jgi:hypothetical protein